MDRKLLNDPELVEQDGTQNSAILRPSRAEAEKAVKTLIAWAGDNPDREGMAETPTRVVDSYLELFGGYGEDAKSILAKTFDQISGYDDIVLVRDIPFYAHCEHHLVPFFGQVHIAYIPSDGVVGLSKLVRLVHMFAHRFQTQENLTAQIIGALEKHLGPKGAAVMVEAEHLCMSMRGVRTPGATTLTQKFCGSFADDNSQRERFFSLVRGK